MRNVDAKTVREALEWRPLIDALRDMFRTGCEAPTRHHHDFAIPGDPNGTLLLMPAWRPGRRMGVKIVNVAPGNSARGLPAISAAYLLSDAVTGEFLIQMDGGELTARRTAAASALAAEYLARKDASRLLILGSGRVARNLIEAHAAVRPIKTVEIWSRRAENAESLAADARALGFDARAVTDLQAAQGRADIIATATLSTEPIVRGDWLRPGAHVDLVGAFRPDMRESDDAAVARAQVFVDTRAGALKEAGDLGLAIKSGAFAAENVAAELSELCSGAHSGRSGDDAVTLFKSVGAALEDLAAAELVYEYISAT